MSRTSTPVDLPGGESLRRRQSCRWLPPSLLLAVALLIWARGVTDGLGFDSLVRRRAELEGFVRAHRGEAALAFVLAYAVAVALSLPSAALRTVSGGSPFATKS